MDATRLGKTQEALSPTATRIANTGTTISRINNAVMALGAQIAQGRTQTEEPLPACMVMLQEALANMEEAAGILKNVAKEAEPSESKKLGKRNTEEKLHNGLSAIEKLLNTTVESCLRVRSLIRGADAPILFSHLNDDSRDGAPL